MKIISKFVDYYDYLSTIYGIEKKFVFNRNIKLPEYITLPSLNEALLRILKYKSMPFKINILAVCGKAFLLQQSRTYAGQDTTLITSELDSPVLWKKLFRVRNKRYASLSVYATLVYDDIFNLPLKDILDLSKQVGSPIFIIEDVSVGDNRTVTLKINPTIPKLSEFKLSRLYPEEQLYQDVEYFISNLLKDSPDLNPPIEIDNNDRIVKHGFDIKASFRHR